MRVACLSRLPLALLLAGGCRHTVTVATDPGIEGPPQVAGKDTAADGPASDLAVEPAHPLELVPARARAVAMFRSATRLAEVWGRQRMLGERADQYRELAEDAVRTFGHDIFDPAVMPKVGIDPSAPLGIAALNFNDEAVSIFGVTTDSAALVALVERRAGSPLTRSTVGNAEVFSHQRGSGDRWAVIVRNGLFNLVLIDRVREGRPDYIAEVAALDPGRSVAHSAAMNRGHAGLPDDVDFQALLDPAGIVDDEFERMQQRDVREVQRSTQQLTEARQRGADPNELANLSGQVQQASEALRRRRLEQQFIQMLLSQTLGSIEGIGIVGDASDRGMTGQIHIALTPDSLFRRILPSTEDANPLVATLSSSPQLVLDGRIDVDLAIELFSQIALANGDSYAEVNQEFQRDFRVDFDRSIRPLLNGRSTLVIGASTPKGPMRNPLTLAAGAWSIGVNNPKEARAQLDAVIAAWPSLPWKPEPELNGYSLRDPDLPTPWWLVVGDDSFIVSNSAEIVRQIDSPPTTAGAQKLVDPEAWSHLTTGTAEARFALHHRLVYWMVFGVAMFEMHHFDKRDFRHELSGEFTEEELRSVPRGARVKALEKRMNTLVDRQNEALTALETQRQQRRWEAASRLGMTVASMRETDTGLLLEGGHYVSGGGWGYIDALLSAADARREQLDNEATRKLEKEVLATHKRLMEARRQEVRRALERRR